MTGLVLRRASLQPGLEVDLVVGDGRVALTGAVTRRPVRVVDLGGRPVLPGLVDHHLHLLGLAAAWDSVDCSPEALEAGGGLQCVLQAARIRRPDGWLRGVSYDVATSGELDATTLGAMGVGPVRVQDRTGIRWTVDDDAMSALLPKDPRDWPAGVQRDAAGRPSGVLFRLDAWLRTRLPRDPPDVAVVGRWLAGRGVTAVTDAGADNGPEELALLGGAGLDQRVSAMTRQAIIDRVDGVDIGPVKILLDDSVLPSLDDLTQRVDAAHRAGRSVAVHCVTEVQLALALAAGLDHRDRMEHASLVPLAALAALAAANPTVVTQPGLVHTRGDRYLREVEPRDHPGLHRLGSLRSAGLRIAAGSDSPYGPADPWTTVAAAVHRRTSSGALLGPDEAVTPMQALGLLSGRRSAPGEPMGITDGGPADLVVLDDGWDRLIDHPGVAATLVGGRVVAGRLPD